MSINSKQDKCKNRTKLNAHYSQPLKTEDMTVIIGAWQVVLYCFNTTHLGKHASKSWMLEVSLLSKVPLVM